MGWGGGYEKIETQQRILYAIVSLYSHFEPLPPFPSSLLPPLQMGSSSSKSSSAAAAPAVAEMESAFADIFADAMERADWHGARKPTWQQMHDEFIVQVRGGGVVAA